MCRPPQSSVEIILEHSLEFKENIAEYVCEGLAFFSQELEQLPLLENSNSSQETGKKKKSTSKKTQTVNKINMNYQRT